MNPFIRLSKGARYRVSDRQQRAQPHWTPFYSAGDIVEVVNPEPDRDGEIEERRVAQPHGYRTWVHPSALDSIESDEAPEEGAKSDGGLDAMQARVIAQVYPEMVTSLLYALATATGQTPKTVALAHGIGSDFLMERDR